MVAVYEKLGREPIYSPVLAREIGGLIRDGYEVSVGDTDDPAYDNPEAIISMFDHLDRQGKEYARLAKDSSSIVMAGSALYLVGGKLPIIGGIMPNALKRAYRQREAFIEEIRELLLFDPTKMPWHLQRGKALALQPIGDAHDLIAVDGPSAGEGLYLTMSGRLGVDLADMTFGDGDGSIAGMSLKEATVHNGIRFYGKSPTSAALYAENALAELDAFLNAPVTHDFKAIVANCQDSLGIRSRSKEVRLAIGEHVGTTLERTPDKNTYVLLSIGCGTAQSILEVARDIADRGLTPQIILIDQDPIALAAAKNLAAQMGLGEYVEIHCERLFDKNGRPLDFKPILNGRTIDVSEDTGLREYLPDNIYRKLTGAVWDKLSDDGMMTTGNMNLERPQPEFLHGLMGWKPNVIMRKVRDGFRLHEQSGIPKGQTRARVTRDGVYTLFYSFKQS